MAFNFRELSLPRLIGLVIIVLFSWIIGVLWLGSFFYLWKIGQPRSMASPLLLYEYWIYYGSVPGVKFWILSCSGVAALALTFPFVLALVMPDKKKLHGDAKLAKLSDLKEAGMLEEGRSFLLMRMNGKYVYAPKNKNVSVILAAPPRSGKGVSQVQPNMLRLDCSVIITDIRQESYQLTSGFRSKFTEVYLINPFPVKARDINGKIRHDPKTGAEIWEARTSQWNPFFYVPEEHALRINSLLKLGTFLFPDPPDGKDPFWSASSRSLFLALSLYVFETEGLPKTIGEVLRQAQSGGDTGDSISDYWSGIIQRRETEGKPLSSDCVLALKDFISTGGNTLTNIRKSLTSGLNLWLNPIVDAMTSGNSFDLRDLRKKKMTIYLGVSPDNLSMAQPLLSLFLQQAMDLNMQEMPEDNPQIKFPVDMILDEITALGRMEIFAKSVGYLNGYGLNPYFIIQSFAQLRSVYGKDEAQTIIDCCHIKMAFPPKSQEEAELLSKEIGNITEKTKSDSVGRGLFNNNQGSTSTSVTHRALFLPQEIKALGNDAVIMLAEGVPPAIGKKILYYNTPVFKARILPPYITPELDFKSILESAAKSKISSQTSNGTEIAPIASPPQIAPLPPLAAPLDNTSPPNDEPELTASPLPSVQNTSATDMFDDIFMAGQPLDVQESTPSVDPAFQDIFNPKPDVSTTPSEQEIEHIFDYAESRTEETIPPQIQPEQTSFPLNKVSDYEISIEEILNMVSEQQGEEIEITPNLLPLVESGGLADLMQDFSSVEIPKGQKLSDSEIEHMVSSFFNDLDSNLDAA